MSIRCNTCGEPFENYKDLAVHIQTAGKSHRKGKLWAAKFVTNVTYLDQKKEHTERLPIDDQVRENREACIRETSGKMVVTQVFCPNCRKNFRLPVEKEHAENPLAWRTNKILTLNCESCRRK